MGIVWAAIACTTYSCHLELKFCKTKPIAMAKLCVCRRETCVLGRPIFFVIFLGPMPWPALFELGDQLECATVDWQQNHARCRGEA
jgi:hypothetical protein